MLIIIAFAFLYKHISITNLFFYLIQMILTTMSETWNSNLALSSGPFDNLRPCDWEYGLHIFGRLLICIADVIYLAFLTG
jgi:hypothetical protein